MSNTTANATMNATMIGFTGQTDPSVVTYSRMYLLSGVLTALGYGVQAVLYILVMSTVWTQLRISQAVRTRWKPLAVATALFAMNTVYCVPTLVALQQVYIDNVTNPLGFIGFLLDSLNEPVNIVALIGLNVGSLIADAYLLWRAHAIFKAVGGKLSQLFFVPAILVFLGAIVMSIFFQLDNDLQPTGIFNNEPVNWPTNYFICSFVLNIYLTTLITLRIWTYQRRSRRVLGKSAGHMYTTLYTVFVESAALYSVVALGCVASFNVPSNQVWTAIALSTQTCASYLITYRAAQGRSWETMPSVTGVLTTSVSHGASSGSAAARSYPSRDVEAKGWPSALEEDLDDSAAIEFVNLRSTVPPQSANAHLFKGRAH